MDWQILLIPLIALGVWIFGTFFKSEDDKTKKGVRGRGNLSARAPGRRPIVDFDRFLDEARQRREAVERPKPAPAPQPVRASTVRPPLRERPPRPREAPRVVGTSIPKEEARAALSTPRPAAPPVVVEPVASPALPPAPSTPLSEAPAAPRPASALQQVRSLLSKPQTAAAAFVLREIFDRPLCRRRR